MANTYKLITSTTLSTTSSGITFSNIPQTYSDLNLLMSIRTDAATDFSAIFIIVNNDTTNTFPNQEGTTWIQARSGTGTSSSGYSAQGGWDPSTSVNSTNSGGDIFSNGEIYFTKYSSVNKKHAMMQIGMEINASANAYNKIWAYSNWKTPAITQFRVQTQANSFVAGTSFWLYGISNS